MRLLIDNATIDYSMLSSNPAAIHMLEAEPELIDWDQLCFNPMAGALIIKYQYMIRDDNWWALSANPSVVELLKEYPDKICWNNLALNTNPKAVTLIESYIGWDPNLKKASHPYRIDWFHLSSNPNAAHLLQAYTNMIDYYRLATNPNEHAIKLLKQYINERNGISINILRALSLNPKAIDMIERFMNLMDETCWANLSYNEMAIHILETNQDKIDWKALSTNPAAIELLQDNISKVSWTDLHDNPRGMQILKDHPMHLIPRIIWRNPSIFTYDYDTMKKSKERLHENMLQELYTPKRIEAWLTQYRNIDSLDEYLP